MTNEKLLVTVALSAWNTNIARAEKTFSGLTQEQLEREVAPGKNRLIYVWGHLAAVHDAMLPLLGFGPRLHPELDAPFLTNPDKTTPNPPSVEEVRRAWNNVNRKLSQGFAGLQPEQWLQKHTAVSDEDFARQPERNRFAVLLSRTNHVAYHLGQAALVTKS
jgi:DinB family protein